MLIGAAIFLPLGAFSVLAYLYLRAELRRFGQESETLFAFRELYGVPVLILAVIATTFFLVGLTMLLQGIRNDGSS